MSDIIMPTQGQSVKSCLIVEWHVQVGDEVKENDPICDVETDKATFEVETPVSGKVTEILFEENADVPVKTVIAKVE